MPATLDDDFGVNGTNVLSITSGVDYIHDMQVLDDGKILAVGAVNDRFGIMRFNADMTLDNTFGKWRRWLHSRFRALASMRSPSRSILSGRIIVVGGNRIARFTSDGALDTTFSGTG